MKKTVRIFYLAVFVSTGFMFTNCHKDTIKPVEQGITPDVNTQNLSKGNYKITAQSINPGINTGVATVTDIYAQTSACEKDNVISFSVEGAYKEDEGATKCEASASQTNTGTWHWNADYTILTVITGSATTDYTVQQNDGSVLKLLLTQNIGGKDYVILTTYTAQ